MHPTLLCRLAALAASAWVVLAASPTLAHAIIVEATPQVGATVHAGAMDVRLRFNSRIDRHRSRLTVLDALGKETPVALDDNTPADVITAHISGLAPGEYRLRWQVLALDGHITRGDIPFTVTAP
ncbi:MAG TPA: copper resistance CopC family protein [Stellaceae bacterium]|nr:copper resistance CopC family protein [Stellaceae bacterium]